MKLSLKSTLDSLHLLVDRSWYIPLIALITGLDSFIWVIPIEPLLISAVLLRPKRWAYAGLMVGIGSAIGAGALAWAIQSNAQFLPTWIMHPSPGNPMWQRSAYFVQRHGAFGLWVASITFVPQPPVVVLAALAKVPAHTIFIAVFAARVPKYLFFAGLSSYAPKLLHKIPGMRKAAASHQPPSTKRANK